MSCWKNTPAAADSKLVAVRKHLPDVLKVPPISQRGNVNEIIGKFSTEKNCSVEFSTALKRRR